MADIPENTSPPSAPPSAPEAPPRMARAVDLTSTCGGFVIAPDPTPARFRRVIFPKDATPAQIAEMLNAAMVKAKAEGK